jgi:hypothetical protein
LLVKSRAENIRQTLVRQKLADELPVPSESRTIRRGIVILILTACYNLRESTLTLHESASQSSEQISL